MKLTWTCTPDFFLSLLEMIKIEEDDIFQDATQYEILKCNQASKAAVATGQSGGAAEESTAEVQSVLESGRLLCGWR